MLYEILISLLLLTLLTSIVQQQQMVFAKQCRSIWHQHLDQVNKHKYSKLTQKSP